MLTGSIAGIAILLVVIAAVVGIVIVGARAAGIAIPAWFLTVLYIVAAAVVCIIAIRFVAGFAGVQ